MNKANVLKLAFALVLLCGAAVMALRFLRQDDGITETTFFYDMSEKKLFAAPREALPPIRGINDSEEDAVRAVVIAPNGNSKDLAARKIAYLEKYAPEFKRQLEQVRNGQANPLPRGARDAYRFVKRAEDTVWRAMNSPEGEKILTEWNVAGPDGKFPTVCTP